MYQVEFLAKHFVFLYRPEDLALSLIQYNKVISVFSIIILAMHYITRKPCY